MTVFDLPVGDKPGWESEDEELRGIAESGVILQSLRQSRERWLFSSFPKFSTKGRAGKAAENSPPPHTLQSRGRCDLQIGPHTFPLTAFYEVQYLGLTPSPYGPSIQPAGSSCPSPDQKSAPLLSSLNSVTMITPTLINQVNSAAVSNPTLANLLQLAAAGKATPEQLKTLGVLIQSLAAAAGASYSTSTTPVPPKDFDLVLEFAEASSERWIFPRGPVVCERKQDDVLITTRLPFPNTNDAHSPDTSPSPQAVIFCFKRAPLTLWDTISRWSGGEEKMKENKKILEQLQSPERSYLGYQLPDGALLSQLQAAVNPYSSLMKSIKPLPAPPPKPKRKSAPRKPPAEGATTSRKASSSSTIKASADSAKTPPVKRQKVAPAKSASATIIKCMCCGQTDVPLILGGRYCRPCVESGKSNLVASGTVPSTYRYYLMHDSAAKATPPADSSAETTSNPQPAG